MKAIRIVLANLKRADLDYHLIKDKDKIVLGVSGGKDSMALFLALHHYLKFAKKKYTLIPVIMDLGFPNFNPNKIKKYIDCFGYDLKIIDAKNVYPILLENQKKDKHLPCSICSRMKKAIINKTAHKFKAKKVAFAHHIDDAVETLFMNMFYSGKIATFEPKMHLSKENIDFIRPLIYTKEEDIARMVLEEKMPTMSSHCPADKHTIREDIKKELNKIYSKSTMSRKNIYTSLSNEEQIKLWKKEK